MSLLFVLFACTGAAPTPDATTPSATTPSAPTPTPPAAPAAQAPDDQIRSILASDEQLNRPAIVGAVGDKKDCVVAVVAKGDRTEFELIVRCGETTARSGALQQWAGFEEGPLWLQDVNGDGKNEVIVLATWMSGAGPTGAVPFQANSVMRLEGAALRHDEAAEAKVGELETEDAVRKALQG
ncbi:MAG: hypothetical protein RIT28_5019 [Pseudomonadota bacterium]